MMAAAAEIMAMMTLSLPRPPLLSSLFDSVGVVGIRSVGGTDDVTNSFDEISSGATVVKIIRQQQGSYSLDLLKFHDFG